MHSTRLFLILALLFSALSSIAFSQNRKERPALGQDIPANRSLQDMDGSNSFLKPGDKVELSVFNEEKLSMTTNLTLNGEATFPLIGVLNLKNLSLKQAGQKIADAYRSTPEKPGYLINPNVRLTLIKAADQIVNVSGAVHNGGEVMIRHGKLDLVEALSRVGGLRNDADRKKIKVTRNGKSQTYNYHTLTNSGASPVMLANNDQIEVMIHPLANKSVLVMGEVHTSGAVPLPLDRPLTVSEAIGIRGGIKKVGHVPGITIARNGRAPFSASANTRLQPGDVLNVPVNPWIGQTVTITGQVKTPGDVAFHSNGRLSIIAALNKAGGLTRIANKKKIRIVRKSGRGQTAKEVNVLRMTAQKNPSKMEYLKPGDLIYVPERAF